MSQKVACPGEGNGFFSQNLCSNKLVRSSCCLIFTFYLCRLISIVLCVNVVAVYLEFDKIVFTEKVLTNTANVFLLSRCYLLVMATTTSPGD